MIKLEISFKTISELSKFLSKVEGVEANPNASVKIDNAQSAPVETEAELTPQQKAAKTRAAKKAKKEAEAAAAAALAAKQADTVPAHDVNANAASVMDAPPANPVNTQAVDRDACIAKAQEFIELMRQAGKEEQVLPALQEVYNKYGIAWKKVSELDDDSLLKVASELDAIIRNSQGAATQQSYV